MAEKKERLTFNEWRQSVDDMVGDRFGTSLEEIEDDISPEMLKEAYEDGLSPATFFREEVAILFDEDDEDEDDFDEDDE